MPSQAVVDFLDYFDVGKLKALKKADLLQVASDLKQAMRVGVVRKLIAENLVEEGHCDEDILEEFPDRQKSKIEIKLELARLEVELEKEKNVQKEKEIEIEKEKNARREKESRIRKRKNKTRASAKMRGT